MVPAGKPSQTLQPSQPPQCKPKVTCLGQAQIKRAGAQRWPQVVLGVAELAAGHCGAGLCCCSLLTLSADALSARAWQSMCRADADTVSTCCLQQPNAICLGLCLQAACYNRPCVVPAQRALALCFAHCRSHSKRVANLKSGFCSAGQGSSGSGTANATAESIATVTVSAVAQAVAKATNGEVTRLCSTTTAHCYAAALSINGNAVV